MVLTPRPVTTKYLILSAGILAAVLRATRYAVGVDEKGLLIRNHWTGISVAILCASVAALIILLTRTIVKSYRSVLKQMSTMASEGTLEAVLADFAKADKEMGGNLYVGSQGLYGKGSSYIALYADMTHLYSVLSDRRGQHPRDLRYEGKDGTDRFLCELDPIGDSNIEIEQLYRRIEKRLPHIKTGR